MIVNIWGVLLGLGLIVWLILKKIPPVYAMMFGSFFAGVIGLMPYVGQSNLDGEAITFFDLLNEVVGLMIDGGKSVTSVILRIFGAGILAGILIGTRATDVIANKIITIFGEKKALLAIVVTTALLTMSGVFIGVAIVTLAPIALAVAARTKLSLLSVSMALVGGGKAGNVISVSPNSIALMDRFGVSLSQLMMVGLIPALLGMGLTLLFAHLLKKRGKMVILEEKSDNATHHGAYPSFGSAISGPITAIILLVLRPIVGISIDPMIALPIGGLVGLFFMKKMANIQQYLALGLERMSGIALLLLSTGTLAGILGASELSSLLKDGLSHAGLPLFLLAPISGILMAFAASSTVVGVTLAGDIFAEILLAGGVGALSSVAMIHTGAVVLDSMPHGSFFYITADATKLTFAERLKLVPYEFMVGLSMVIVSTILFGVMMNI
ncbi:GntP family permease [Entomospira culicis]|uniref:GntP family permease n=1 Tax=Entomospira culicis TaxID=2719989 RepID=UPI001BAF6C42|nr:GntP family permease [Entomospira culicis]WDI36687.1 hypothetical protein PVA46_05005 [Entomospira culicis]WDI38316.1 hypothetical protein PVA47_05015 [Entomospira culicis]